MENSFFYSWATTKTETGFNYTVSRNTPRSTKNEIGNYCDCEILAKGELPTRARAKAEAQRLIRKMKTFQKSVS